MKGLLSKSAITKMWVVAIIVLIVVVAIGVAYYAKPATPRSTPSPTPTPLPTPTATPPAPTPTSQPSPTPRLFPRSEGEVIIGVEYVIPRLGEGFSDLGIPAVKPLPEHFSWDKMQKDPDAPIDFSLPINMSGSIRIMDSHMLFLVCEIQPTSS